MFSAYLHNFQVRFPEGKVFGSFFLEWCLVLDPLGVCGRRLGTRRGTRARARAWGGNRVSKRKAAFYTLRSDFSTASFFSRVAGYRVPYFSEPSVSTDLYLLYQLLRNYLALIYKLAGFASFATQSKISSWSRPLKRCLTTTFAFLLGLGWKLVILKGIDVVHPKSITSMSIGTMVQKLCHETRCTKTTNNSDSVGVVINRFFDAEPFYRRTCHLLFE